MPDTYVSMLPTALDSMCKQLFRTDQWQGPLSRMLDVNRTTVNRWVAGKAPVPKTVHLLLMAMHKLDKYNAALPAEFSPGFIMAPSHNMRDLHDPSLVHFFGMKLPTTPPRGAREAA
jgi:hypothetical protein